MMNPAEVLEAVRVGNVEAFVKQLRTETDADRRRTLIVLLAEHQAPVSIRHPLLLLRPHFH